MRTLFAALPACVAIAIAAPCAAEWVRVSTPRFELLTNTGEKSGRQALQKIELIHHVFGEAIGAKAPPLPVRIFLLSGRDYRPFQPSRSAKAFFQSGPERDYIVLGDTGAETTRASFHEYIHLVLHHHSASLPRWLEEGVAEFYSTLALEKNRLLLGLPIPTHLQTLAREPWLDPNAFQAATRGAPMDDHVAQAGLFYAQSWALVHMLNLVPAWRRQLPRFSELLAQATPAQLAFEQAFGRPMAHALESTRLHLRSQRLPVMELVMENPPEPQMEVTPIPDDQAELAQLDLLILLGRSEEAERRVTRLERSGVNPVSLGVARGLVALSLKQSTEALRSFRAAIDAGTTSAWVYLEYAMLLRETGAAEEQYLPFIRQAAGRNPNLAEAHFLLALHDQKQGAHRQAIEHLEEATRVLPRQSYFWHALALSWHALGEDDRARRAARRAADSAARREELEMAQAVLRLTTRDAPAEPPPRKPPVFTPDSWKPKEGNATLDGVLEHIDCLGVNARFHVRSAGKVTPLWIDKPGEVLLRTASGLTFDFSCGPQRPRQVLIEYTARTDPARKTEGSIVAIEFR